MKPNLHFPGIISTACICLLLAACSPKQVTVETHVKDGLQFSFNSDWTVTKDAPLDANPNVRSIQVEGPNNALVCMICFTAATEESLEAFAENVAANRKKNIDKKLSVGALKVFDSSIGTSDSITGNISGHPLKGVHQHFSVSMLGNDIPHDASFFCVQGTKYKVMIMTQVAQENAESARPAIDLILNSFKIDGE